MTAPVDRQHEATPRQTGWRGVVTWLAAYGEAQELRQYVVYLGFIVILLFFGVTLNSSGFLTANNLLNIVRQTTPVTVMAVATVFTLSAAEIDLSMGATVGLTALTSALALQEYGMVAGVLAGLAVGLGVGLFNGLLAVKLRIPSFLVTLGTLSIVSGLTQSLTNLQSVPVLDPIYTYVFGSGSPLMIPSLLIWSAVALVVGHAVYNQTRYGRHVLATGGNREAAAAEGINTDRIRISVLILSGMTAALAGMLYAGRLHGAQYTLGSTDLLTVIAAVAIGGTSLFGGRGSVVGAVIGSILLGMLNNGLILMGLAVAQQMVAQGILIVIAVVISLRAPKEAS